MEQYKQINDVRKTERNTRKQNREETHSFLDVMKSINIDTLHDALLKACNVEKPVVTGEINGKSCKHNIQDSQTHKEQPNTVLVGLIECSLGLDHASEAQVGGALPGLLWVLVDTTHALVSYIENKADNLWCLCK